MMMGLPTTTLSYNSDSMTFMTDGGKSTVEASTPKKLSSLLPLAIFGEKLASVIEDKYRDNEERAAPPNPFTSDGSSGQVKENGRVAAVKSTVEKKTLGDLISKHKPSYTK